ncbi:MAG: hypothetical protein WCL50_07195, partial [Spirochaetota bacterium]
GESLGGDRRRIAAFAAQGLDFFFHNSMTAPYSTSFGKLLHDEGYGRLVSHMATLVASSGASASSGPGTYVLAFMTHAILDRVTHPYIVHHSGWVDPARPGTAAYYQCHAYFERVIDVLVLRQRKGTDIGDYDFFSHVDLGPSPPEAIVGLLAESVALSYPGLASASLTRESLGSAYRDSMWYWEMTNPPGLATLRDRLPAGFLEPSRRFLALVHPRTPDDRLDYLNYERQEWTHPWDAGVVSRATFMELYEEALERAVPALRAIAAYIGSTAGRPSADARLELEALLGNSGLDSGRTGQVGELPRFSKPLPLAELVEALYA